jgi:hypothetical protein
MLVATLVTLSILLLVLPLASQLLGRRSRKTIVVE